MIKLISVRSPDPKVVTGPGFPSAESLPMLILLLSATRADLGLLDRHADPCQKPHSGFGRPPRYPGCRESLRGPLRPGIE